jgi:hypothetical protein
MTFTRAGLARQRYVAVFDILGFQDLITKKSLASVTDSYDMFEFLIVEMSRTAPKAVRRRLTQLFFQDTVLVYTNTAGQSDLEALLMYCSGLVGFGLAFDIRLRGAIARGKLFANKAGVLGRPLITAYRMSQTGMGGLLGTRSLRSEIEASSGIVGEVSDSPEGRPATQRRGAELAR